MDSLAVPLRHPWLCSGIHYEFSRIALISGRRGPVWSKSNRVQPSPTQSNRVQPSPTQSNPVQPSPTQSNRVQPSPTQSNPVQPSPTQSNSVQLSPTQSNAFLHGHITRNQPRLIITQPLCNLTRMATSATMEQQPPAAEEPGRAAPCPELLAPAGDWDCAKAAVENGADAIYFGLAKFNARMRAHNFTEADLPKLMEFLHRRGVKGYVTFNTLVFENELADAENYLRAIIAAGVDAAIVQDVGICKLIRELSPDFPIHASTQMTITSAAGIEFARNLGCNLAVLARECSIAEIEKIRATDEAVSPLVTRHSSLPLEVFVHGALCVAYSGQCLTSESLGGRSANRGECAQACRMPYDLISDGQQVPLGDKRYLLSPQDLSGLEVLPELVRAGVASLKIEGRLKSPA